MRRYLLTDLGPAPAPRYRVVASMANVREGPGTQFPVALSGRSLLRADEVVEVDGAIAGQMISGSATWLHLANGVGFVHSSLLTIVPEVLA